MPSAIPHAAQPLWRSLQRLPRLLVLALLTLHLACDDDKATPSPDTLPDLTPDTETEDFHDAELDQDLSDPDLDSTDTVDTADDADTHEPPPPTTLRFDPDRTTHYFDLPYPSDHLLSPEGTVDLNGYPTGSALGAQLVGGWARRAKDTMFGFGLHPGIYFRFTGEIQHQGCAYEATRPIFWDPPALDDPVLLIAIDADPPKLHPVEMRFINDGLRDPFVPNHLLMLSPVAGAPLASGQRYAAVVTDRFVDALANPVQADERFTNAWNSRDSQHIAHVTDIHHALTSLGIDPERIVGATAFTTQDINAQFDLVRAAVDTLLQGEEASAFFELQHLQPVQHLAYVQGQTPSGADATVATVTYADASQDHFHLDPQPGREPLHLDLDESWPMRVYEAYLHTPNFLGLADLPYAGKGFALFEDLNRQSGRLNFAIHEGKLTLLSQPEPEAMRIVIQLPRRLGQDLDACKIVVWDHGTGGTAYNAVLRAFSATTEEHLAQVFADHGYCVISRDQPLYGKRFDLIDGGYDTYLSVYNIGNLSAMRDYFRQAAIDAYFLHTWMQNAMPQALVAVGVIDDVQRLDTAQPVKFGHSLGSVTSHVALGLHQDPNAYRKAIMSGAGGLMTYFFTEIGIDQNIDPGTAETLRAALTLLGVELRDGPITAPDLVGGLAGVPTQARAQNIDRLHPILSLFQMHIDPGDPISYAPYLTTLETIIMGIDDLQVPNIATAVLLRALPFAEVVTCEVTDAYDPHICTFREPLGRQAVAAALP